MKNKKFTLYLGLNDKDTKTQKFDIVESFKFITNFLKLKGFTGATVYNAKGLYMHENGEFTTEETLRIELMFCTRNQVLDLCNELKGFFNQESIALQEDSVKSELV